MYLPRDSFPFRNSMLNDFYFLISLYMKYLGIWFDRVHLRKRIDSYRSICGSDAVGRLYTELHYSRNGIHGVSYRNITKRKYCYCNILFLSTLLKKYWILIRITLKNSHFLETIQTLQLLITQNLCRIIYR